MRTYISLVTKPLTGTIWKWGFTVTYAICLSVSSIQDDHEVVCLTKRYGKKKNGRNVKCFLRTCIKVCQQMRQNDGQFCSCMQPPHFIRTRQRDTFCLMQMTETISVWGSGILEFDFKFKSIRPIHRCILYAPFIDMSYTPHS